MKSFTNCRKKNPQFLFFAAGVVCTLFLGMMSGCTRCSPEPQMARVEPPRLEKRRPTGPGHQPPIQEANRTVNTRPEKTTASQGLQTTDLRERIKGLKGKVKIVISKGERRLYLFEGEKLVKSYRVGLGKRPQGDKVRQGDKRTPDGIFYVCTKNPKSRFHLSLGISYPTIEDAERGLRQGLISKREYNQIVTAIKRGQRPPWNTALGGAICIHGGGAYWDWTDGCIALNNKDIEELFKIIPVGTPIVIVE